MTSNRVVESCQICGEKKLSEILFLGFLPPVNDFHELNIRPKEEVWYPAEILYCENCHLLQSGYVVDPRIVFPRSYPYTSGTTKVLRDNFAELSEECRSRGLINKESLVIDIGSNDGTLLSNFKDHCKVLGITPEDVGKLAIEKGIPTILDYFTPEIAERVLKDYGKAKVITAANVFAHIDNIHEVVESILKILADDGVFVVEVHYLLPIVELLQFDTVYHEHLRHYSLHSLSYLLRKHGLEVVHAKPIPSHAGSIRVYASRAHKYKVEDSVSGMLQKERALVTDKDSLKSWAKKVASVKAEFQNLLGGIKMHGGRIYGIGAPSRGTTLMHYLGITEGVIDCTLEIKGSYKINKYVPGTRIPVIEESKLYEDQPEFVLLFSWQITDELIPKIKAKGYRGKFIIPLPHPRIV